MNCNPVFILDLYFNISNLEGLKVSYWKKDYCDCNGFSILLLLCIIILLMIRQSAKILSLYQKYCPVNKLLF